MKLIKNSKNLVIPDLPVLSITEGIRNLHKFHFSFPSLFTNLTILLLFIYPPSDFDLGWHLRYGEYFWQHFRLLRENIFSYNLPDYLWVNTSWSYDIWLYPLFKWGGFLAMAIAGAIFPFLVIKIIAKTIKASHLEQLLGAVLLSSLGFYSLCQSLRGRHPSFVIFAVLYYLLTEIKGGQKKYLLFLPPLFFVGANLHGQALLGLLYLFMFWLVFSHEVYREPKKYLKVWLLLALSGVVSGLITLINPFGIGLLKEVLNHIGNPQLSWIFEYQAPEGPYLIGLVLYIIFLFSSLLVRKKSNLLKETIPLLPLIYLSFQARRNMIFLAIFSLPLAIKIIQTFLTTLSKNQYFSRIHSLILAGFFVALVLRLAPFNLLRYNWETYCQYGPQCSEKATQFLEQNLPPQWYEQGFNFYNWGGYLDWRLPKIKTYIDGRMTLWQTQGRYPIEDHKKMITAEEDWEGIFQSYDFTWALVPPQSGLASQLDFLVQNGTWQKVYADENAVIYFRLPLPQDTNPQPPKKT